jgi:hypothetical protein
LFVGTTADLGIRHEFPPRAIRQEIAMMMIIGRAVRPGGLGPSVMLAALAACLASPASAGAASPISASLACGVVGQGEYGTIKGRLVWGGDTIPPVRVLEEKGKAQKDPNVCAKDKSILSRSLVVDPDTKGVSFAFAFLRRPNGENPQAVKDLLARNPKVELDQQNCEFVPYVVPMHRDQVLLVKSSDVGINHNVRLTGFANPGVNSTIAAGRDLEIKLEAERQPIPLQCDIHPWMKGWVMVCDHPFFAVTGKDGSFEIKGVPPGEQKLVIWQESVGYANPGLGRGMSVMVKAGDVADIGVIKLDPSKVKS